MNIIQSILAMILSQLYKWLRLMNPAAADQWMSDEQDADTEQMRYWANIINTRGTDRCELCCYIFTTKEDAEQHRRDLESTASFMFVETVSFRSRRQYQKVNR